MMTFVSKTRAWLAILPMMVLLAGCETARLNGIFGSSRQALAQPEPGVGAPTSPVTSEPLPDSGEPMTGDPSMTAPAPEGSRVGMMAPTTEPAQPATPRGLAGNWKIADARGTCSITLTQSPLLDLYRATPSGCQAGSIAKVNAWQQRGQEIVLIEPGGRTAVRLFPKGDGTYEGAATTSGALVKMGR